MPSTWGRTRLSSSVGLGVLTPFVGFLPCLPPYPSVGVVGALLPTLARTPHDVLRGPWALALLWGSPTPCACPPPPGFLLRGAASMTAHMCTSTGRAMRWAWRPPNNDVTRHTGITCGKCVPRPILCAGACTLVIWSAMPTHMRTAAPHLTTTRVRKAEAPREAEGPTVAKVHL